MSERGSEQEVGMVWRGVHQPRWQYDCERCKYGWLCGPATWCLLYTSSQAAGVERFPDPPEERRREVEEVRKRWSAELRAPEVRWPWWEDRWVAR